MKLQFLLGVSEISYYCFKVQRQSTSFPPLRPSQTVTDEVHEVIILPDTPFIFVSKYGIVIVDVLLHLVRL